MSGPATYPDALVRHYDQDYDILRRDAGDVAFYRQLALDSGGPVLEVACGNGRVLLPIADSGLTVTGVDATPAMLADFERKLGDRPRDLRDRVTLDEGLFTDLGQDGPFALVFSAFRAFQHVIGRDAQRQALREMARVLAPGGLLAFDLFDFDPERVRGERSERGEVVDYTLQVGDVEHQRLSGGTYDDVDDVIYGRFRWTVDGEEVARGGFTMQVTSHDELLELIDDAGLELVALYSDFDKQPWQAGRPRELIPVARRPA